MGRLVVESASLSLLHSVPNEISVATREARAHALFLKKSRTAKSAPDPYGQGYRRPTFFLSSR